MVSAAGQLGLDVGGCWRLMLTSGMSKRDCSVWVARLLAHDSRLPTLLNSPTASAAAMNARLAPKSPDNEGGAGRAASGLCYICSHYTKARARVSQTGPTAPVETEHKVASTLDVTSLSHPRAATAATTPTFGFELTCSFKRRCLGSWNLRTMVYSAVYLQGLPHVSP